MHNLKYKISWVFPWCYHFQSRHQNFYPTQKFPHISIKYTLLQPCPQTTILPLSVIVHLLALYRISYKWSHSMYIYFFVWLLSLRMILRFIYLWQASLVSSILLQSGFLPYGLSRLYLAVHFLMDTFLVYIHIGAKYPSNMVNVCLILKELPNHSTKCLYHTSSCF